MGNLEAGGMPGIYIHSGYGEPIDGYRVAYLVTDLSGEEMHQLPIMLRNLQEEYPAISRLSLLIYANEKSAELSRRRMGEIPMDGGEESELDKNLLATYEPNTNILTNIRNDRHKKEDPEKVEMDWEE